MLIINLTENERVYFDEIINNNPDDTEIATSLGFDGTTFYQLIFNDMIAISAQFLTALGIYLAYKIEKKKVELKEQEMRLQNNDKKENDIFEIKLISKSKKLIYSDDDLDEEKAEEIIANILNVFKS